MKLDVDAGSVPYRVKFKNKYPKVDIHESVEITKKIKDNNNLELVGNDSGELISVEIMKLGLLFDRVIQSKTISAFLFSITYK